MTLKIDYIYSFICIFLLLMVSCSQEDGLDGGSLPILEIMVNNLSDIRNETRSSESINDEEKINNLWISFYDKNTDKQIGSPYLINGSSINKGNIVLINKYDRALLDHEVKIVLVCNVSEKLEQNLNGIKDYADFKSLKTDPYLGHFSLPPYMFGSVTHTFGHDNYKAKVDLCRLPAKVHVECDISKLEYGTEIESFIWEGIPLESSILPDNYIEVMDGRVISNTINNTDRFYGLAYPYEYSEKADVKVKICTKNNGRKRYYYCPLPETIRRNYCYMYRLTLIGDGGTIENPELAKIKFWVVPWTENKNDIVIGNTYLECSNDISLYVRTQGTVINPEHNFKFKTNVPLSECQILLDCENTVNHKKLLTYEVIPIDGGGIIKFKVKDGVFYEFHPRVYTSFTIKAGNIERRVNITLIPLIEIDSEHPNVIVVWPGHEFYNQSINYGGLYIQTPLTKEGWADNQQAEPNMCQKIEIYDQDRYGSLFGNQYAFMNYDNYYNQYYEDFYGYWNNLNNMARNPDNNNIYRVGKNIAEALGDGWRLPTEYELRAMYQAWAHFGRPASQGGSDDYPAGYETEEEQKLYDKARKFYNRFHSNNIDNILFYGCTTCSDRTHLFTVAQVFNYVKQSNGSWAAKPFYMEYPMNQAVLFRPIRDYVKIRNK